VNYVREYQAEMWKVVAGKMGESVTTCRIRGKALGLL
jgi:hypothetical protein